MPNKVVATIAHTVAAIIANPQQKFVAAPAQLTDAHPAAQKYVAAVSAAVNGATIAMQNEGLNEANRIATAVGLGQPV